MFNGDMFPAEKDPTGGMEMFDSRRASICLLIKHVEPETWTETELRRWLKAVSQTMRY